MGTQASECLTILLCQVHVVSSEWWLPFRVLIEQQTLLLLLPSAIQHLITISPAQDWGSSSFSREGG